MTGAVKRPGRGVVLSTEEIHAFQHALIEERLQAWRAIPRLAASKLRRREASKKAWWALTGHLRACHGSERLVRRGFLRLGYDEVEALHRQFHRTEETSREG